MVKLHQRRDTRMVEPAIGLGAQVAKLVLAQRIADERGHHGNRRFHIACGAQRPERLHRKLGPAFRHIKPAVAGKARQGHFFETERGRTRSEEHTSELQSLMRISYAVFCLKKKTTIK